MSMHKFGKRLGPAALLALILALTSCAPPPGYLSTPAATPAAATPAAAEATTARGFSGGYARRYNSRRCFG